MPTTNVKKIKKGKKCDKVYWKFCVIHVNGTGAGPSTINNVCDTRGQGVQLPSYRGVPLPQTTSDWKVILSEEKRTGKSK